MVGNSDLLYCHLFLISFMVSLDWHNLVVGYIFTEDLDAVTDDTHSQLLEAQLNYCLHLNLKTIIFQCPSHLEGIIKLARLLNAKLVSHELASATKFLLHIKIESSFKPAAVWRNDTLERYLQSFILPHLTNLLFFFLI